MTRRGTVLLVLWSATVFGACNLVLGIDDVSSATGPDGGQQISPSTAEPHDASVGTADASASARADAEARTLDASPAPSSPAPALDASLRDHDASPVAASPDAAVDEDAGADLDDAGLPR